MMRILFFIFCCLASAAQAQKPPITLKTNPLEWINPYKQTFSLHTDLPINDKLGLELGLGYVFDAPNFNKMEASNSYVALTVKGSMVEHEYFSTILRQGGQYQELWLRKRSVNMAAIGIIVGSQEFFMEHRRIFIEPYVGLGARVFKVREGALPLDAESVSDGNFFSSRAEPGTHLSPDFIFGIHIGFHLGQRYSPSKSSK
jgi:hypothetical protein